MIQTQPPVDAKTLAGWQSQLDELFPHSEHTTWMKLVWVAGDDWEIDGVHQGIERFYIFEMIPQQYVDPDMLFELRDMPRPVVRYDAVMKTLTGDDRFVTRLQWDLFKETGCLGKPFWILQGSNGGHQRWFTTLEKQFLELQSLPTSPPLPGTLPYAPFDKRVVDKLVQHDRLRKIGNKLYAQKRSQKEAYKQLHANEEQQLRQAIVDFLKDQITTEEGKEVKKAIRDTAIIQDTVDYEQLCEEAEERFITSGRVVATN